MARAAARPAPPDYMQLALPMAPQRQAPVRLTRAAVYDAGSRGTRRSARWVAPTASPNEAALYSLTTLRDRSRHAVRNDGWPKGAIDKLVFNVIGTGIKPLSKADDAVFARQIQDLWTLWTDYADAAGLLDAYGLQSQATRCWFEAGEVFVRIRQRRIEDALPVPLQLEVIEPELCPHTWTTTAPNGNRIKAGIEFNAIGRRVAYWFYASRPGDIQDFDAGDLRRIPAESVIHMFDPLRAGQLRGIPHLTQAMIRFYELDKFDDATLMRQQIQNLFAGFLRRSSTSDTSIDPMTGQPRFDTADDGRPIASMEPGTIQELGPDEQIDFSKPPDAGSAYPSYMATQLRAACAAAGIPYEILTGDMSGLNDRSMRVVLNEFRRGIQARQHGIVAFQLCRPIWKAFLDDVFAWGILPIPPEYLRNPEPWSRVKWMPQGWQYTHPVQDVDAAQKAIKAGFTSRSAVVAEQGEDSAVIDEENAEDNRRAGGLGLTYESGTGAEPTPPNGAAL